MVPHFPLCILGDCDTLPESEGYLGLGLQMQDHDRISLGLVLCLKASLPAR